MMLFANQEWIDYCHASIQIGDNITVIIKQNVFNYFALEMVLKYF